MISFPILNKYSHSYLILYFFSCRRPQKSYTLQASQNLDPPLNLPSTPMSSRFLFPSGFLTKTLYAPLFHTCHTPAQFCSLLINANTAPCYIPLRKKYLPQHPILERPRTTFLNLRDKASHPHNTTGKITVLYI